MFCLLWFFMVIFSNRLLPLSHSCPVKGSPARKCGFPASAPLTQCLGDCTVSVGRWTRKYIAHVGCHGNGLTVISRQAERNSIFH